MIRFVSLNARVTCRDDLGLAFTALDLIWMRGVKTERCCTAGLVIMLAEQTIVQDVSTVECVQSGCLSNGGLLLRLRLNLIESMILSCHGEPDVTSRVMTNCK